MGPDRLGESTAQRGGGMARKGMLGGILAAAMGLVGEALADDATARTCISPDTPAAIRPSLLSSLQSAGAAEWPARRAFVLRARGQEINAFRGGRNIMDKDLSIAFVPVGPCLLRQDYTQNLTFTAQLALQRATPRSTTLVLHNYFLFGGLMGLGPLEPGGQGAASLVDVAEVHGALFPMKPGAHLDLIFRRSPSEAGQKVAYDVGESIDAARLDPRLSGRAWPVHVSTATGGSDEFFLEDLGVTKSLIDLLIITEKGAYGMAMPQVGVARTMTPAPGMQAVETFSEYRLEPPGP